MFNLKNFLINVLDIISPQLSSKLRVIKANLNGEIKSFLILKDLSRKSKNIIDIGARVGFFTFMFRSLNPRLNHNYHLFEPFPPNLLILYKLFFNDSNVFIHPYALSDKNGSVFFVRENKSFLFTNNALTKISKKNNNNMSCIATTLDKFSYFINLSENDFIKIDVEGFEKMVLDGSEKIISEKHPIFFIEIELRHTSKINIDSISEIMNKNNYNCYYFFSDIFIPMKLDYFNLKNIQNNKKEYINNFLFLNRNHHIHLINKYMN